MVLKMSRRHEEHRELCDVLIGRAPSITCLPSPACS